ncbi:serine/threonine-protein kinase [Streptomyces sp. NPDC002994]|uniref:serine/threonine-protein kinase n=1 Tax=Streptomyces sp. NPDC002994 TaxID=3154441 RepID=UPI0033A1F367
MKPLATGDPVRLGPYRLAGVLGEGGMGKVYFGQDSGGRTAAVKVLRPELAHDQHLAQRFVREAQMAAAVTGKGVARVLGAQTEGGRPWIATEFLAGPTLEEAIGAYGPMDDPAVRALAAALARTLHDIHSAGLVHRDLKPANIVLTSSGPRVIDFGIARPEHGLTLTTTGQIPVTPGYGAPEQVLGQRVGPPSDLFSLGAVLVYAATGQRAFDGGHVAAVQYEVVHGSPDVSRVPPALLQLIGPCLSKDPALRPVSTQIAAAFAPPKGADRAWRRGPLADDIAQREAAAKRLVATDDTGVPGASTRRRFLVAAGAAGAGLLAAGGAGAWWVTRSPEVAVPAAVATPVAAFASLIDSKPGEAPAPLWGPIDVTTTNTPRAPLPVRDVLLLDAKGGGLVAHRVTDGRERWRAADVYAPAGYVSVADRLVAAADIDGVLHAFIASTGQLAWKDDISAEYVLAADDSTVYVMTQDNRLLALDAWTRKTSWSVPLPWDPDDNPATAAVGSGRLVLFPSDGHVRTVDTKTGVEVWDLPNQGTQGTTPAIAGGIVYLGGRTLTARSLKTGTELWTEKAKSSLALGGWSNPFAEKDIVFAMEGWVARRYHTIPDVDVAASDWGYYELEPTGSSTTAPAVQGATVWIPEIKGGALAVVHKTMGRILFSYKARGTGTYRLAADGNRVFISRGGSVTAMPVYSE